MMNRRKYGRYDHEIKSRQPLAQVRCVIRIDGDHQNRQEYIGELHRLRCTQDKIFVCCDCHQPQIWTVEQQRWCALAREYASMMMIRCRSCCAPLQYAEVRSMSFKGNRYCDSRGC